MSTTNMLLVPVRKIVGGRNAKPTEAPYQVALFLSLDYICGGSIISPKTVITAAHCVRHLTALYYMIFMLRILFVRAGSLKYQSGGVQEYVNHAITHKKSDLTLLILRNGLQISRTVKPIKLASEEPGPGRLAIISGWGLTTENGQMSSILQVAAVFIIDLRICMENHQKICAQSANNNTLTVTYGEHICAGKFKGGVDTCQGDSGGPLVVYNELVGVTSFGSGCAHPNLPGVYTSISKHKKWITANLVN